MLAIQCTNAICKLPTLMKFMFYSYPIFSTRNWHFFFRQNFPKQLVDDNTNLPENIKPIDETETKQNESDTHEETPDVAEKTQPTTDIETKDSEHEETPDVAEKAQPTNDI